MHAQLHIHSILLNHESLVVSFTLQANISDLYYAVELSCISFCLHGFSFDFLTFVCHLSTNKLFASRTYFSSHSVSSFYRDVEQWWRWWFEGWVIRMNNNSDNGAHEFHSFSLSLCFSKHSTISSVDSSVCFRLWKVTTTIEYE